MEEDHTSKFKPFSFVQSPMNPYPETSVATVVKHPHRNDSEDDENLAFDELFEEVASEDDVEETLPAPDAEAAPSAPLDQELASEEGIDLNDTYWSVLNFMRKYYAEHNIAPDVRHVITHLANENQSSKRDAKKIIFDLFPYGYVKQACKLAGMKKNRAWSTG